MEMAERCKAWKTIMPFSTLSDTLLNVDYSLSKDGRTSIIALLDHIIAWGASSEVGPTAARSSLDER